MSLDVEVDVSKKSSSAELVVVEAAVGGKRKEFSGAASVFGINKTK